MENVKYKFKSPTSLNSKQAVFSAKPIDHHRSADENDQTTSKKQQQTISFLLRKRTTTDSRNNVNYLIFN